MRYGNSTAKNATFLDPLSFMPLLG